MRRERKALRLKIVYIFVINIIVLYTDLCLLLFIFVLSLSSDQILYCGLGTNDHLRRCPALFAVTDLVTKLVRVDVSVPDIEMSSEWP